MGQHRLKTKARVADEPARASLAVDAFRVITTNATTRLHVARRRVPVTGARHASGCRTAIDDHATEPRGAVLAELPDVSLGIGKNGKVIKS